MTYVKGGAAVCLGLVLSVAYWKCGQPMSYEFPGGFRKWVTIQFESPSCPPLKHEGIFLVVSVPSSGRVCTSTAHPNRWVYHKFEYVYPDGRRRAIRMRSGLDPAGEVQVYLLAYQPEQKWEVDFVGTKEEAEHWGTPPYAEQEHPSTY